MYLCSIGFWHTIVYILSLVFLLVERFWIKLIFQFPHCIWRFFRNSVNLSHHLSEKKMDRLINPSDTGKWELKEYEKHEVFNPLAEIFESQLKYFTRTPR